MRPTQQLLKRFLFYIIGIMIMTAGYVLCDRSHLGISPYAVFPRTMTYVWQMPISLTAILFHTMLVMIEFLVLRGHFRIRHVLQIPMGILFTYFLLWMNNKIPVLFPGAGWPMRTALLLAGIILIAIGVFLYVPTDLVALPMDGAAYAITRMSGAPFANVRFTIDLIIIIVASVVCLMLHRFPGRIGPATIAIAILSSLLVKVMSIWLGPARNHFLGIELQ